MNERTNDIIRFPNTAHFPGISTSLSPVRPIHTSFIVLFGDFSVMSSSYSWAVPCPPETLSPRLLMADG